MESLNRTATDLVDEALDFADELNVAAHQLDSEALVVDFTGVEGSTATALAALELGHAAGNRHWNLAVEGERAYLPLSEKRERMEDEIHPHLPGGATVTTDDVSPALFDDDDSGGHGHAHGGSDHSHSHDGHSRTHDHASGHTHGVREIDPEGQP